MSNNENLIPFNERTEEEVRAIAKKGGINSGKARKEKAALKKTLLTLLESDYLCITYKKSYFGRYKSIFGNS